MFSSCFCVSLYNFIAALEVINQRVHKFILSLKSVRKTWNYCNGFMFLRPQGYVLFKQISNCVLSWHGYMDSKTQTFTVPSVLHFSFHKEF